MTETWYIMEDGSVAHPRDVKRDAQGVLRHKDGRAVAMRGSVPRTRSVDVAAELRKAKPIEKPADRPVVEQDMKPEAPRRYRTRESKAD